MKVNRYWLDHVWGPIGEGNKLDSISMVDMNEPANLRKLVIEYLQPYFNELAVVAPEPMHRIKETWRYALNVYDDELLRNSLENQLPPFETPNDIRQFYELVWEMTFPGEDWRIQNVHKYEDIRKQFLSPWDDV